MIHTIALTVIGFGLAAMIFIIKKSKITIETCLHKNTFTYTDSVVVTCETTTITCLDCGERLLTKTDC